MRTRQSPAGFQIQRGGGSTFVRSHLGQIKDLSIGRVAVRASGHLLLNVLVVSSENRQQKASGAEPRLTDRVQSNTRER